MTNLRAKLIRLAYRRPDLRSDLLPLLKSASPQDDDDWNPFSQAPLTKESVLEGLRNDIKIIEEGGNVGKLEHLIDVDAYVQDYIQDRMRNTNRPLQSSRSLIFQWLTKGRSNIELDKTNTLSTFGWSRLYTMFPKILPYIDFIKFVQELVKDGWVEDATRGPVGMIGVPRGRKYTIVDRPVTRNSDFFYRVV